MQINPVYITEQRDETRRIRFIFTATAAVCGTVVAYMLLYAAARDQRAEQIQRRIDACNVPGKHAKLQDGVVVCVRARRPSDEGPE